MHRTRVVAAALTLALPLTTAQIVEAPVAQAQSSRTKTITEVDTDAYNAAVAQWTPTRDSAQAVLETARATKAAADLAVAGKQEALEAAQQSAAEAKRLRDDAAAELELLNVEARERDADAAVTRLNNAEAELVEAKTAAAEAESAYSEADAAVEDLKLQAEEEQLTINDLEQRIGGADANIAAEVSKQADLKQRERTGADFTLTDWERLTGQAIAEIINDYRVANGLHPLVTHEVYINRATQWSDRMVADIPVLGEWESKQKPGAFRHSTSEEFGWSAENILYNHVKVPLEGATRDHWKVVPEKMFEQWRNSPGHNRNMLNPTMTGIGLGIETRPNGQAWATTMFFRDDRKFDFFTLPADEATQAAKRSGKPFYVPSGALTVMQAPIVAVPSTDTKGHVIDFSQYDRAAVDKSPGKEHGMDPVINVPDYTALLSQSRAEQAREEGIRDGLNEKLVAARTRLDEIDESYEVAVAKLNASIERRTETTRERERAQKAHVEAEANAEKTSAALERAKTTPKEPFEQALVNAENALTQAESATAKAIGELDTAKEEAARAVADVAAAERSLADVQTKRPVEQNYTTEREVEDEDSSAGTVIAIIVAILAVVGIAVAALPQLGIQLPF